MLYQFKIRPVIHWSRVLLTLLVFRSRDCFGQVQNLSIHNIDEETISVSGLSGGAGMSVALSYILSSKIRGVGVFSGAPYPLFYLLKEGGEDFNPTKLEDYIVVLADLVNAGKIDDTSNLRRTKAFVFRGSQDYVPEFITDMLMAEYRYYGADVKNMTKTHPSVHCVPTDNYGPPCSSTWEAALQVNSLCNCGYQGVSEMFRHIYGSSFVEVKSRAGYAGSLFKFNQNEFFENNDASAYSLNDWGYAYIPKACALGRTNQIRCKLHFVFHGCSQNELHRLLEWPFDLVENAGYLQAADANNIIVIFPQSVTWNPTTQIYTTLTNTPGCWDTYYGFTGCDYLYKTGKQIQFVSNVIKRLSTGE